MIGSASAHGPGQWGSGNHRRPRVRYPLRSGTLLLIEHGDRHDLELARAAMQTNPTIWTIGHSTRSFEVFLALLTENRIQLVADVRSHPGSRRYPQYGQAALRGALSERALGYQWMPSLGGRRRPRADSPNGAWRNEGMRGYADYMLTAEFNNALEELLQLAGAQHTAAMCAEAVWWRCHRSLIADALKARGVRVLHIMNSDDVDEHLYTAPARILDGKLTYAADMQASE